MVGSNGVIDPFLLEPEFGPHIKVFTKTQGRKSGGQLETSPLMIIIGLVPKASARVAPTRGDIKGRIDRDLNPPVRGP